MGTIRPILRWPDKRLRTAAAPVETITDEIRAHWADMVATMDAMPGGGVGLSAPQIGVMLRLAVVDASTARNARILMANPELVRASDDSETGPEGSPCLPGTSARIRRPARITVRYLGADGHVQTRDLAGLEARSCLHQIDHLAGRMYFDRLSRVKRDMLLRKARK